MMEPVGKEEKLVSLYVDGASRGNPGPAGVGVIIYDGSKKAVKKFHKAVGTLTNNAAEYLAVIYGLQEALIMGKIPRTLYTDSELVSKQVNREYRIKEKELKPFYAIAMHLIENIPGLEVSHIDRAENQEADKLANEAIEMLL